MRDLTHKQFRMKVIRVKDKGNVILHSLTRRRRKIWSDYR
ncbi:hypothetical protein A2U01_0093469, partial [Trifolium medium]|nr:hypothetical protein [Trifolium medium]